MKKFWEYKKGMEKTMLTIGEPLTLDAEQTAGVFAYKFAKLGYETFITKNEYFVSVHVRKHEFFSGMHFPRQYKNTINGIDKLFHDFERHLG